MVGLINIILFSHILCLSFFEKLYEYAPDILSLEFLLYLFRSSSSYRMQQVFLSICYLCIS